MQIISPVFQNNQSLPLKHTCDGPDTSPALEFKDVPPSAKSLVLIMDDPDAIKPAGRVWDHWIVWNIPPETRVVAEGNEPPGLHGRGSSGNLDYHGPCPPDGQHRYFFKLYALDVLLNLPLGSSKAEVEQAMSGHVIDRAELVGLYVRK